MNIKPIKKSYINISGNIYDPDFINLAIINDDCLAFDQRTRFLSKEKKDFLNAQEIAAYSDVIYISEHNGNFSLICDVSVDDYLNRKIITHELILPDTVQGMLSNVKLYNAEAAPVLLLSESKINFKKYLSDLEHDSVNVDSYILHIFTGGSANIIHKDLKKIPKLTVADGHHRLYTSSLLGRKSTVFSCIVQTEDANIHPINRILPNISVEHFERADKFIKSQFQCVETSEPITKGQLRITYREHSYVVNLIDLESDAFWNNDVYRLNTQILSQAFGIFDTSLLDYYICPDQCKKNFQHNKDAVLIEMAPITMEEFLFITNREAVMPPKSTAFSPKFPSFLIFKKYSD